MFSESRFGKQSINKALVGIGPVVRDEGIHFGRGRRKSCEVERDPANEGIAVGFAGRHQFFLIQAFQNKSVDGRADLEDVAGHLGDLREFGFLIGPMDLVFRAFFDPLLEELDLIFGERFPFSGRRHHFVLVIRKDAVDQLAVFNIPRDNGGKAVLFLESSFAGIQTQLGFAVLLIWPVTMEALV